MSGAWATTADAPTSDPRAVELAPSAVVDEEPGRRSPERGAPATARDRRFLQFGLDPLARVRLRTRASAGVAFDLDSGRVLWRRNARSVRPIASLTKVMTALLVVESTRPRDVVRVPPVVAHVPGSRMGFLRPGRHVRVEALLHGLLMSSANDAATALAVHVAGSERRFVAKMNRRAREFGLACTRFASPHGLSPRDRSCAADLAELAVHAMMSPRIAAIVRKPATQVRIGGIGRRWLATTNPLLISGFPGVIGLKTGWTGRAGRCLIAVVRQGTRRRAVVLLDADDPGGAARRVFRASARI